MHEYPLSRHRLAAAHSVSRYLPAKWAWVACLIGLSAWSRAAAAGAPPQTPVPCSPDWLQWVEQTVSSGDGQGHGPDIGSGEWKSVIEFKLGLRGAAALPTPDSQSWCRFIDEAIRSGANASIPVTAETPAAGPSYDCGKVSAGSIEAMICNDSGLSLLDRQLADVYRAALAKAGNEHPPTLKAEQRGWIKGRNDCWKSTDKKACVDAEYQRRIAELQAHYRLLPANGPFFYFCEGNRGNEIVVSFFDTDPPTLIAERGDSVSLMYRQPSASGARYQGRNESFWEHQGEALVTWGFEAPAIKCQKAP